MAYPVANGGFSNSGTLTPNLYDETLRIYLYHSLVLTEISNTNHTSKIKNFGDKVTIRQLPAISISSYSITETVTAERLQTPSLDFYVDKGKKWAFSIDDVDRQQADIKVWDQWAQHAAKLLAEAIDADVLGAIVTQGNVNNYGATAGVVSNFDLGSAGAETTFTASTALTLFAKMKAVLNQQKVPDDGNRWVVIPAVAETALLLSELRQAYLTGDQSSGLRTNKVGKILGFNIYTSEQVAYTAADTAYNMPFGHKVGLAFATQLTKTETLRNQQSFGDIQRGLQVYGYKVIVPEAIGAVYASVTL